MKKETVISLSREDLQIMIKEKYNIKAFSMTRLSSTGFKGWY